MKLGRRFVAVVGAVAVTTASGITAWGAFAAPGDPQLGLRVASPQIRVERVEGDPFIFAELGTFVGVTKAALQIEAVPGADGNADLWLVRKDARGTIVRDRKIQTPVRGPMSLGLPDFLDVELRTAAGALVTRQTLSFCPGGAWGMEQQARLDATGPAEPQLANSCGTHLTRHIVYGLDKGWAASVGNDLLSNFEGADGDYRVTLRITPTYVKQFAIPAAQAKASVSMTVTTVPCPYEPDWCAPPEEGGGGSAALSRTAPTTSSTSATSHGDHTAHGSDHAKGHGAQKLDPVVRAAAADVSASSARTATLESSTALRIASAKANPQRRDRAEADGSRRTNGLPDMVALPAFDMQVGTDEEGRDQLSFGANIANLGSGPLVVEGYRSSDDTMRATQFEYRDGEPVRSSPAGEFEWDPREGHLHWHFEDIAQYDLVAADGSVTRSGKQAFCLAPTDPIDLTIRGAAQRVETDRLWSNCGGQSAIWIREVLPAGWGDTYYQGLPGQAFDVTGLPNGTYTVRVTTNFRNRLKESDTTNNVSHRRIELGGSPGERTVTELD
ncbi:lysyl oxidase family protein [Knoellia flava]|uniref:lysyl oxidase family protein n=1 Tax=Knoellia flava TaxID=913969 RepID=UPI0012EB8492|nr:lysyl oxidase family protein [Knoellia flava]